MKKHLILLLMPVLLQYSLLKAQDRYFTRTGTIRFFSETPVENIEAINHQVSSLLDMNSGDIALSAQLKGFEFEKALMQEHFNENYVESDKFPAASFRGRIMNFDPLKFEEDKDYEENVEGELTLHGQTKKIKAKVILRKVDSIITGKTQFTVAVSDFDIKIPKAVINNIAESIAVFVDLDLEPYNR